MADLRDIVRRLRTELRVATNAEPGTVSAEELAAVEAEAGEPASVQKAVQAIETELGKIEVETGGEHGVTVS